MSETNEIALYNDNTLAVFKRIGSIVSQIEGVEKDHVIKALTIAGAVTQLKAMLSSPDSIAILKGLMGSAIGFKTDKSYNDIMLTECATQALIHGLHLTGNQFNIIADNFYITKEGYQAKLKKIGVKYSVTVLAMKRAPLESTNKYNKIVKNFQDVEIKINWTDSAGKEGEKIINRLIKDYGREDPENTIGKATRKALHCLYCEISGENFSEAPSGDFIEHEPDSPAAPLPTQSGPTEEEKKQILAYENLTGWFEARGVDQDDAVEFLKSRGAIRGDSLSDISLKSCEYTINNLDDFIVKLADYKKSKEKSQ